MMPGEPFFSTALPDACMFRNDELRPLFILFHSEKADYETSLREQAHTRAVPRGPEPFYRFSQAIAAAWSTVRRHPPVPAALMRGIKEG